MVRIARKAEWIETKRVYLRQLEKPQIRIGFSEVFGIEFNQVVTDEIFGTLDELIKPLQRGL